MSKEIASDGETSLHVYRDQTRKAHGPRVHLRRSDGGPTTVFGLPLLGVLIGPAPSSSETRLLLEHLQDAIDAWEELND